MTALKRIADVFASTLFFVLTLKKHNIIVYSLFGFPKNNRKKIIYLKKIDIDEKNILSSFFVCTFC